MQTNIFELIDLLVKMSGSNSNLDELKADLKDTEEKIESYQKKINDLEDEMNDEKYFDASSEIVDRNIEISLIKKIQKLTKTKQKLDSELEDIKSKERETHNKLEDIRLLIDNSNNYINIVNDNGSSDEAYTNMISIEKIRVDKLNAEKEILEKEYAKIQGQVEYLATSSIEISEKIEKEQDRLAEVTSNLANIKAYIDVDAKENDEKKYIKYKDKLEELNNHKNEIINDAVYVAGNIKEFVANDEKDSVESEFTKLINIVKEIPFMDLKNEDINSEKEQLDNELNSFNEEISKKEYQTRDSQFMDERIKFLEDYIKLIDEKIQNYRDENNKITSSNETLSIKICNAEKVLNEIGESLKDYEDYDYESEEIPKSVVQAAYNKLMLEKDNISEIAEKYRENILQNIESLDKIKIELNTLTDIKQNSATELDELNKKLSLNTTSNNVLEEEKDKVRLSKINKKVVDLKNREQFNKSVSEIYEEFQMLNSSLEFVDKETRLKRNEDKYSEPKEDEKTNDSFEIIEEPEIINEPSNESIIDEELNNIESDNESVLEEVKPLLTPVEDIVEPEFSEDIFTTIEEEKKEILNENPKLRVVEVIPITDEPSNKEESNFMVNDFQDDEYIDIDSAISSVEEN